MEFQKAKYKSNKIKIAIAAVIIANKPENITIDQYFQLLQANFCAFYTSNSQQIVQLKSLLFTTRKQLFLEQNKETLCNAQDLSDKKESGLDNLFKKLKLIEEKNLDLISSENIRAQFSSNLDFLTNLIKLKSVEKTFRLNENSIDVIAQCLTIFLNQIRQLFFESDFIIGLNKQTETNNTTFKKPKFSIPIDTLLHSLQVFLNIYDIEWLYYIRSNLIEKIRLFIKDLIKFILNFPRTGELKIPETLISACQMIIIISTSDYLLNMVVNSTIKSLQISVDYICEMHQRAIQTDKNTEMNNDLEFLAQNCSQLANCIEFIVRLRNIDNFSKINGQVKMNLIHILNTVFINLSEIYPLLAIQISKIMQLMNIDNEK